ncbi:MAG: glycosyltransferase [Candidatus Gastranaerophilales bacterium]|nr:glycosyltransferase [Candidatus Gastranaerophilales bacterium]
MPKVSVIVPAYNVEKYLARCLDSLIFQTLGDIEIICVNDGSSDSSADILARYAERDNRIKVVYQENYGMSAARNLGLKYASGEFIGFVDADDFIDKNYYEYLYDAVILNNADIACASVIRENEKKKYTLIEYTKNECFADVKLKFENAKLPQYCFVWNKIYRRDSLVKQDLSFIDGMLYEDMIYTPDVLLNLGKMVTVSGTYYHYWKNENSAIKIDTDESRANKLYAKQYLLKICRENNIKLCNRDNLEYKMDYNFLGIKLFKVYKYRTLKKYYLFGLIPVLTCKEYV